MESESRAEPCLQALNAFKRAASKIGDLSEAHEAEEEARRLKLESLLRSEILPRLANLHHPVAPHGEASQNALPTAADLERFCALLIAPDVEEASAFLNRTAERGLDFEGLVEHLITPAARRLGELWHEDRCDFFDVTFGVARLQELIDLFGPSAANERECDPRVLLISLANDSHFFGLDIVASFLRAAGWSVTTRHGLNPEQAARAAAEDFYPVIGVTVGGKPFLEEAARAIDLARRASMNPNAAVMVGGYVFNRRPELVARLGADGSAPDGPTAVMLARRLLLRQQAEAAR